MVIKREDAENGSIVQQRGRRWSSRHDDDNHDNTITAAAAMTTTTATTFSTPIEDVIFGDTSLGLKLLLLLLQ
jgi:hypothetical protein